MAAVTLFLVLRAFSSGASALTGVEAVADGVQAFRRPQAKNAAATLAIMGFLASALFLGITVLSELLDVRITEEVAQSRSVLSLIGDAVFGGGLGFILLQVFTAGILVLAANTAFQDFPRLSSILARDQFMPSQFRNRGDRLVFSNGVLVLAGLALFLVWLYDANAHRLIQLYVIGVFTAFTLSQAGMVRRWFRVKGAGWRWRATLNGVGAAVTGIVLVVATITKFAQRRLRRGDRDPHPRHALPAGAQALPTHRPAPADRAAHRRRRGVEFLRAPRRRLRSRDDRRRLLPVHDPMPAS